MESYIENKFEIHRAGELNDFVLKILDIGENYLKFLSSKGRLYLSPDIEPKDAAVDLLAEIFTLENNTLVKFKDFFENNFSAEDISNKEDFERFLRSFIYTVIQNNLPDLFRENDPSAYHIYRNVKSAVKNLNYFISIHFSGKYIHKTEKLRPDANLPDREELNLIINDNELGKEIYNLKIFIRSLFEILSLSDIYTPAVYLNDVCSIIKSIFASEFINRNGAVTESEHISELTNIKFILEDVKFAFTGKLEKYASRNNLSQNFSQCIYNIVDEIIGDFNAGKERRSVMDLMKTHFNSSDKYLFYKVQYCIELLETEIIKHFKTEKNLIGK